MEPSLLFLRIKLRERTKREAFGSEKKIRAEIKQDVPIAIQQSFQEEKFIEKASLKMTLQSTKCRTILSLLRQYNIEQSWQQAATTVFLSILPPPLPPLCEGSPSMK